MSMSIKTIWLVENFTNAEDYRELIKAVKDSGRECFVIGRHEHGDFDPKGFNENDCVMVQGSIQMTKNIRSRLPAGCFPVAYSSWDKYLCSAYYPHFKGLLFNDNHKFLTLKQLKEDKFGIYLAFGRECMVFVRPDSGEKTFQAQLIDLQDFDRFWENGIASSATDDDLVVISTPKKINGEWRFVCSKYNGGEIIAGSTYQYQGKRCLIPSCPNGATELCKKVLKVGYYPDSVFCVDVFQDGDGIFWLGELTSFSSAGLYVMNKTKVGSDIRIFVANAFGASGYQ